MKLSKAQESVMNEAKKGIDTARAYNTYDDYFVATQASHCNNAYNTPEKYKAMDLDGWNRMKGYWEAEKNAIVCAYCNTRTLKKLESLGLIQIIEDSTGETFGIDTIKVLNY